MGIQGTNANVRGDRGSSCPVPFFSNGRNKYMKIVKVLSATGPVVLAPVCGSFFHTHHGHHGTFSGVRVSKRVYFFFQELRR